MTLVITIALCLIIGFILWRIFKPYIIRYDNTLCITGGLGSGKSLTTIKTAIVLLRKQRFLKWKMYNFWKVKLPNLWKIPINKHRIKLNEKLAEQGKPLKKLLKINKKRLRPYIYSNIPIHYKKHMWSRKKEWSQTLTNEHIMCLQKIREYSIVVIDELPQFINQFNWNQDVVQKNVNEFITFFRHYIGGYFITNAQSVDDIVVQVRRKLNTAIMCFDFHAWPISVLPLFYTVRMCDMIMSDQITNMSTTYIEENTRLHFGLFPPKKTYDSRCYSERYNNTLLNHEDKRFKRIKTNRVLRLQEYTSPLDDTTTDYEKRQQLEKAHKLCNKQKEQ